MLLRYHAACRYYTRTILSMAKRCFAGSSATGTASHRPASAQAGQAQVQDAIFETPTNSVTGRRFLIVGLGNCDLPHTRHSVGMTLVDHLANLLDATWLKNRDVHGKVSHATVTTADGRDMVELVLLKSRLPMNLNGRSVRKAVDTFGIADSDIYLMHDELDKVLGKCVIKEGGSARGHNGVKSVIQSLNTSDIARLRFGIDRPSSKSAVTSYVLQKFTKDEMRLLQSGVLLHAIKTLLRHIETNAAVNFPLDLLSSRTVVNQSES